MSQCAHRNVSVNMKNSSQVGSYKKTLYYLVIYREKGLCLQVAEGYVFQIGGIRTHSTQSRATGRDEEGPTKQGLFFCALTSSPTGGRGILVGRKEIDKTSA